MSERDNPYEVTRDRVQLFAAQYRRGLLTEEEYSDGLLNALVDLGLDRYVEGKTDGYSEGYSAARQQFEGERVRESLKVYIESRGYVNVTVG